MLEKRGLEDWFWLGKQGWSLFYLYDNQVHRVSSQATNDILDF